MSRVAAKRLEPYVCHRCLLPRRQTRLFHPSNALNAEKSGILNILEGRGYINQIAGDRNVLSNILETRKVGFYAGIDPTAPSLHLGHLLPLMVLFWLQRHGHNVVSLVGGGTARVGDPSGRLTSRAKTAETLHTANFNSMHAQLGRLWQNAETYGARHGTLDYDHGKRELLNNASWLNSLNILDFLKTIGSGMRIGTMLGRDTVRNKLEKGDGMSFSEFTYPLLQAWDWWHLYKNHDVQVQIGGSDQYGNIIAGIDAVKHIAAQNAVESRLDEDAMPMGLTVPLLTTSSGEKFGKSAGNAVWLDASMTSAFDLYGFLLRSPDADVERYLKLFTFIPLPEIAATMLKHTEDPGKRVAQHLLAREVLELVHGSAEAEKTQAEHSSMRNVDLATLTLDGGSESRTVLPSELVLNTPFARILYHAGIAPTKSEGARMVAKGGVYVAKSNQSEDGLAFVQVKDQRPEDVKDYVVNGLLVLRTGKWKTRVIEVIPGVEFDARALRASGWEGTR